MIKPPMSASWSRIHIAKVYFSKTVEIGLRKNWQLIRESLNVIGLFLISGFVRVKLGHSSEINA